MSLTLARTALVVLLVAGAALGAALYFEHALGYAPCALCLYQRWAYYAGVALAAILVAGGIRFADSALRGVLVLIAIIFAANALVGLYHAGVEWNLWTGPQSCRAGTAGISGNLLEGLRNTRIVPCDRAPWRFLGLSFAGWNMVVSAAIVVLTTAGLRRARGNQGSSSVSQ